MISISSSDESVKEKEIITNDSDTIISIDPGSVNCGICFYDIKKNEPIRFLKVAFRDKIKLNSNGQRENKDKDLGNSDLIESVRNFIFKNWDWFSNHLVFIEDQHGDTMKHSNNNEDIPVYAKEIIAVQHTFQALLGLKKCTPIAPIAVKSYYRKYFPIEYPKERLKQYRLDKKNAIFYGRILIPNKAKETIEEGGKEDDWCDAFFIGKYVAESIYGVKNKDKKKITGNGTVVREIYSNTEIESKKKKKKKKKKKSK